ncbi:MAG: hypothetical protein WA614_07745 [Acidimicrobiales bacterium]
MIERVIVIEERLASMGVALAIGGVLVAFLFISTLFFSTSSSTPVVAIAIETVVVLAMAFVVFLFWQVIVRVVETPEGRALEILYGPGGFVRQTFGPDDLEEAYARDFSFAQMGGWGYRGSLRLLRQAALVTRRGEALELILRGKRRFIVTVNEPAEFVAALQLSN